MMVIEIENVSGLGANGSGTCNEGRYRYVVKINRRVVGEGEVDHDRSKHWSLLLRKIAADGRDRLFTEVVGMTPEEFKKRQPEKIDDLALWRH